MDELSETPSPKTLPFNNLFLISGLVNGLNKWWMYLSGVLLLFLGYVFFQAIALFPLSFRLISLGYTKSDLDQNPNLIFDSTALQLDKNLVIALELGMFVFAFIGLVLAIRFIHRKKISDVITGYQKFRLYRFLYAFVVWTILLFLFLSLSYWSEPTKFQFKPDWPGLILSFFILLLLMPIQTGCEELFFRGYLVQGLSQLFKNGWLPLILTSSLFALAHMGNPEVKKHGWEVMFIYYACFALFLGVITLLDEGIELAFGIHFANNFISSLLISTPNSVVKTYAMFEVSAENPQAEMKAWAVMAFISFLVFAYKYKWKNYSLILK